ncbi:hypothetical protein L207DRAFT_572957 [Hyaloscypha variabilis F]|uniref:Uncharacterized protein n=1 Tax=Hyaloscypha variabilis (strain UAMH 11265 / GT02V1 / F) TaxID=1149755 RepID=A0A2J6QYH4_HYAVF|nr:hypothetical protein L207DRAFT_572957 [Hyaloscypha variabilis F]
MELHALPSTRPNGDPVDALSAAHLLPTRQNQRTQPDLGELQDSNVLSSSHHEIFSRNRTNIINPGARRNTFRRRRRSCKRCCIDCRHFCVVFWKELWMRGTCCDIPWWVMPAYMLAVSAMLAAWCWVILVSDKPPTAIDLSQCPSRVSGQQATLFTSKIYFEQFNYTLWNARRIWEDEQLCAVGFQGNSDIYGLGIRIGLYLQWFSSLLANHALVETRKSLSQAYLIFSLAIFITIMVMTGRSECDFTIELVMLYIMFFGGFLCVFYRPNLISKENPPKWLGMTWHRAITMCLYGVMIGHAAWFWPIGYNSSFVKMPCGTTLFFFGPISDVSFIPLRVLLGLATICGAVEFAVLYPLFVILFSEEIKRSILESAVYQGLFPRHQYARIEEQDESATDSTLARWWAKLARWHRKMRSRLAFLKLGLFKEAKAVEGRAKIWSHVFNGVIGCGSFIWSISAIELIISWNKITGVHNIDTTGQYIPLVIGICSLVTVLYELIKDHFRRKASLHQGELAADDAARHRD